MIHGEAGERSCGSEGVDVRELVAEAEALVVPGRRSILGLAGSPGAGKSTVAQLLASSINRHSPPDRPSAIVVGMDGFHLAQVDLERLGRTERKGAPDTFDAVGFVALVTRLAAADGDCVYAPIFRRDLEEPIAGAVPVPREIPLVIIEGNYLLLEQEPWSSARHLFTQVWFLTVDEELRHDRLITRHVEFGRTPNQARDHALGSDERNAQLIAQSAARADRIVDLTRFTLATGSMESRDPGTA